MFDGLREKLGNFTKDVEEAAEVEELDENERAEGDGEDAADLANDDATEGEREDEEWAPIDPSVEDAEREPVADVEDDGSEEPEFEGEPAASATEPAPEAGRPAAEAEGDDEGSVERFDEPVRDDETEPDRTEEDAGESEKPDESEAEVPEGTDADETGSDDGEQRDGGPGFTRRAKAAALGRVVIDEERLEEPLWELEMALLESDVEMGVAEEILDRVREELIGETRTMLSSTGEVVEEALADAIHEVIGVGQFDFDERIAEAEKPVVIVFTGVNGVGKTTSIAKLSRYLEERGYSSVLANGDTYRAGANEQIREHARRLDRKLIAHEQGSDPTAVIYDAVEYAKANGIDVVLGDTAGRLHTDRGLMDQLAKIDRVVGPDMVLFVDEAVAGQDAVSRAREFNEASAIDGAILSKADADSQGGAAISIAHVTGKPILFLGTGQGYDDLVRFDPEEMVDRLLGEEP
ncbi:signal recognition particle-docking protein FtsY [Natronorarus salvus]|uniref:signal recognition particle-docking protein FtsY n=1 Tax=Natronorarus salvus TaxID=3117733 RepID=UPI002F262728